MSKLATPVLGFGCTRLAANDSRKAALRNLSTAYDNGVRYFDTARLYGYGRAESILGEFIKGKRDQLTIVTKAGLEPREFPSVVSLRMINIARKSARIMSSLLPRTEIIGTLAIKERNVCVSNLRTSLERSLKELRVDYVDYLLLHEVAIENAHEPEILRFCEDVVEEGKVRAVGIGGETDDLRQQKSKIDKIYTLLQYPIDLGATESSGDDWRGLTSVYGVTRAAIKFRTTTTRLKLTSEIERQTGLDLRNTSTLHKVLVATARIQNENGIVLFSSSKDSRITETINAWNNPILDPERLKTIMSMLKTQLKFEASTI